MKIIFIIGILLLSGIAYGISIDENYTIEESENGYTIYKNGEVVESGYNTYVNGEVSKGNYTIYKNGEVSETGYIDYVNGIRYKGNYTLYENGEVVETGHHTTSRYFYKLYTELSEFFHTLIKKVESNILLKIIARIYCSLDGTGNYCLN